MVKGVRSHGTSVGETVWGAEESARLACQCEAAVFGGGAQRTRKIGKNILLWLGGLRAAMSKPETLREWPFWRACGPEGTGRGARLFISPDTRGGGRAACEDEEEDEEEGRGWGGGGGLREADSCIARKSSSSSSSEQFSGVVRRRQETAGGDEHKNPEGFIGGTGGRDFHGWFLLVGMRRRRSPRVGEESTKSPYFGGVVASELTT